MVANPSRSLRHAADPRRPDRGRGCRRRRRPGGRPGGPDRGGGAGSRRRPSRRASPMTRRAGSPPTGSSAWAAWSSGRACRAAAMRRRRSAFRCAPRRTSSPSATAAFRWTCGSAPRPDRWSMSAPRGSMSRCPRPICGRCRSARASCGNRWTICAGRSSATRKSARGSATVPPYRLLGRDELQLRFDMRPLARGECVATPGDLRAAIEPDSTIDLRRIHRHARMPNLGFFASAGYPFTRHGGSVRHRRGAAGTAKPGRDAGVPRPDRPAFGAGRAAGDRLASGAAEGAAIGGVASTCW